MADRQSTTVVHDRSGLRTMIIDVGTPDLEPEAVCLLVIPEENSPHEAVPDKRALKVVGWHPAPDGILLGKKGGPVDVQPYRGSCPQMQRGKHDQGTDDEFLGKHKGGGMGC